MYSSGQLALFVSVQPVLSAFLTTHTHAAELAFANRLRECGLPVTATVSKDTSRMIQGMYRDGVLVVLSPDDSTIGGLNAAIGALYKSGQLNIFATKPIIAGRFSTSANDFVWEF